MVPKILVVDDARFERETLQRFLEALEIPADHVLTAASAKEALAVVEQTVPDLVLLDLSLPDASGAQLAGQLRERLPGARLLAVTGYAKESPQAREAFDGGVQGLLEKPVDLDDLDRAVKASQRT